VCFGKLELTPPLSLRREARAIAPEDLHVACRIFPGAGRLAAQGPSERQVGQHQIRLLVVVQIAHADV
jgi:hypothetical protein